MKPSRPLSGLVLGLVLLAGCKRDPVELDDTTDSGARCEDLTDADPLTAVEVWSQTDDTLHGLPEGSPTLCDLDGDGVMELVVPMAPPHPSLSRIAVVDATTGRELWETELVTEDDFAAPFCVDVDGDGTLDVLTAGRSGDVHALDGRDGRELWTLSGGNPDFLELGNTYAVVSPDGERFFVTQGGGGGPGMDGVVAPDVPGRLMAFDRSGAMGWTWSPPGPDEVYAAPAVLQQPGGLLIAVGTGGERLGGSIYLLELPDGATEPTIRAAVPSTCGTGGFVASPVFGDLTGDGLPEVVGADFCGGVRAMTLDGTILWTSSGPVPFGTANPLLVDLDEDGVLDVVAAFESVNFSFLEETRDDPRGIVQALRGTDGIPLWDHRSALWILASPVSADLDRDGTEDVLVLASGAMQPEGPRLLVLGGRDGEVLFADEMGETASTPVIGEVDGDRHLDLFFADGTPNDGPLVLRRLEFCGRPFDPTLSFSGFRGRTHDGVRR